MWISRKRFKDLEKRIADHEKMEGTECNIGFPLEVEIEIEGYGWIDYLEEIVEKVNKLTQKYPTKIHITINYK